MEIESWPLTKIIPYARNPRKNQAVAAVKASIKEFGFRQPIVVDRDGVIVAGHTRYMAAQELELKVVPVHVATELTPIQIKAYRLADNRTAQNATWDDELLGLELQELQADDFDLDLTGFDDADLARLLDQSIDTSEIDAEPQIDKAEELREKWQTATGQLWACGEHKIICGNCTDAAVVARVMGGERADACVTDPPYGIGWDTDYTRFTTKYGTKRINHPPVVNDDKEFDPTPFMGFDKVVLWGANWYCKYIPVGTWLIWDKRHSSSTAFLSDAELAWMKGGKGIYIYAETVQGAHRKEHAMHPTQKPVGLMQWCIEKAEINGIIYDPFLGSGTTLIACERLGRRCFGIEIAPGYVAIALQRFFDATGIEPTLLSG